MTSHAVVQAESHIRTPQAAEEVLAAGHADLVSIVRGQIADPHLVAKARAGHADRVRPCISCNQLCWGRRSRDYWISCLINPSAGREHEWGGDRFAPAERPRTVLVVGGGPAGLEAARVAAERGHAVVLVEARDRLGGQWVLAGRQPTRSQILDHLAWYERELDRLGVDVRLGTPATAESVGAAAADVVVLAAGARPADAGFQRAAPLVDRLPGIDAPTAASIHAVLEGDVVPHGRVLLLDDLGDWRGIGTAMHLQEAGSQVTLVTAAPAAAGGLFHSAADGPARRRFARAGGAGPPPPRALLVGARPRRPALDADRRRARRRLRLARRRRDPCAPHRAGHRAHRGRHRPPRDRRLRGRPPRQPRHLRGSNARRSPL